EERGRLTSALTLTPCAAAGCGLGLGLLLPSSFPYGASLAIVIGAALLALAASLTFRISGGERARPDVSDGLQVARALQLVRQPALLSLTLVILGESAALASLVSIFRGIGRDVL